MDCKKVIFVHLPKTGGTLIREYFNFVSASQDVEIQLGGNGITKSGVGAHGPIEDFIDKEQAYKFGLVRNPFDWYVSRYFYFIKKGVAEGGVSIENDCGLYGHDFCSKFPTVKSHILYGIDNPRLSRFWLSDMYKYMFYNNDSFFMDHVGKLETIDTENQSLWDHISISPSHSLASFDQQTSNMHRNRSAHEHYSSYYDQEMTDIIYEKDKLIFDKYGYTL